MEKHVTLLSEITGIAEKESLFESSELEQYIVDSATSFEEDMRRLRKTITLETLPDQSKIKLVLLFALRFQSRPEFNLSELKSLLQKNLSQAGDLAAISRFFHYNSLQFKYPGGGLSSGSILQQAIKVTMSVSGRENTIYTQHEPLLTNILESLRRAKLPEDLFPTLHGISKDR